MNRLMWLIGALVLWLSSGTLAASQSEQRVALVIGNADYLTVGKLKNPEHDATAIAALLREEGFEVIERENVTRRAMIQATRDFADKLTPGGVGLLFYAGHGVQAQGANYLIPVDAVLAIEDDLKYETLDLQDVLNKLDDARVRLSIVILDACRDNPFRSFRSSANGLALINPPVGTVIAYATAPGKVARDGTGLHSIFTTELLRAMSRPDKLLDVFEHVTDAVERQTENGQTPWINSSFRGDFYFTGPTTVNITPLPAPENATSLEIVFWQSIIGSTKAADYDAYLKQFPNGSFAALARLRLTALAAPAPALSPQTQTPDAKPQQTTPIPQKALPKPVPKAPPSTASLSAPMTTAPPPKVASGEKNVASPEARPTTPRSASAPIPPPVQEAMIVPHLDEPAHPHALPYCRVPHFTGITTGAGGYATITVANTGDRCGTWLRRSNAAHTAYNEATDGFDSLSLSRPPHHGSVTFDNGKAFYYTPAPGYVGDDDFAVDTKPWGSFRAVVTVLPPDARTKAAQ